MTPEPLPIDGLLPEILASLRDHPNLVLEAPTGAGKTTRVPPSLLEEVSGQVILVEPRRLAVRAAARRMALERGERVGQTIGYTVRMDKQVSASTRVLVMTPGILLRRLLADPFLEGIDAILFDEFHERGLDGDLGLAAARQLQRELRPELKLLVMSATLDVGRLQAWLAHADAPAPRLVSEGRAYPVSIEHRPVSRDARLEDEVAAALQVAHGECSGNLLVFLPGRGEIARVARAVQPAADRRDVELLELYGEMNPKDQDRVLQPSSRRRWILATNVAESSVTVHGVEGVIDAGYHRRMEQDPVTGLDHLVLTRISRASAAQRTGRAGRTAPGRAWRLWGAHEEASLAPHDPAEVHRVDPTQAILWLLAFGESRPQEFGWFDAPKPAHLQTALDLLQRLGAWREGVGLTERGKALADLPLHPRLACLLLEGASEGVLDRAALAVALCSERWPFEDAHLESEHHSESDLLDAVDALEGFRDRGTRHAGVRPLRTGPAKNLLRLADRFARMVPKAVNRKGRRHHRDEALLRAIAQAFRDRLAVRRAGDPSRARMVGGGGVRIAPQSAVRDATCFVCVEILQSHGEASARVISRVDPAWYGAEAMTVSDAMRFDGKAQRVQAYRQRCVDGLVLEEKPIPIEDWEAAHQCLVEAASREPRMPLAWDDPAVDSFLERARFLMHHLPEEPWPDFSEAGLAELLPDLAHGCKSFAELRKAPLLDHLRARFSRETLRLLEREAPSSVALPQGRSVRLQYDGSKAPVLAARIQALFGLEQTPRVARGRVPVLLHLLAPNGRPQQVTDDLQSFWSTTYSVVRKELRRRYPKHAWPEDPRVS